MEKRNKGKKHERIKKEDAPTPKSFRPSSFNVDDVEGYKYLNDHGYVVFSNVLTNQQIEEGRNLAWEYLESLPSASIDRKDPKTWDKGWPDPWGTGIIALDGAGQSKFQWYVRGNSNVLKIFRTIWNTTDLITSFDGFCIHRPFEYNSNFLTNGGWFHVDQNGKRKPNRVCIQGLVNFYDSNEEDGGIVVVPDSIHVFKDIFKSRSGQNDFVMLDKNDMKGVWKNECKHLEPIKICANAGDMILWDSRTIHCNTPATKDREIPSDGTILTPRRLVSYVCMTPAERLNPAMIKKRREAFKNGDSSNHWPEECVTEGRVNNNSEYVAIELNVEQKKLVPL